jgi:RNA polymerase sigma-70 factor, ECF subfamily
MNMNADLAECAGTTVAGDDLELVHATQNGDISAFEQLVERYDCKLLRIAQHVTHNREDSQDAVQESFMKALQHLDEFREQSRFSTWLFRITVNQSLMKLRKRRTAIDLPCDQDFPAEEDMLPREIPDGAPNPEELCQASELRNILVKAIEELRPALRTVFVLRDVEGLSISQTAMVLDLSAPAVKTRLLRARLQLRELLSEYFKNHAEYGDQPEDRHLNSGAPQQQTVENGACTTTSSLRSNRIKVPDQKPQRPPFDTDTVQCCAAL